MAYAALVSLSQTIDLFRYNDKYPISVDEKQKIISIHEYVISLISYLEKFPEKLTNSLEGKIADAAHETEDVIEYFMLNQIQPRYQRMRLPTIMEAEFEHQLEKVAEEIGSIAEEIMDIKKSSTIEQAGLSESPAAISSSRPEPRGGKNDMVSGLDDDLMTIKDRLCRESSKLEVIPILGMGGIGKTTLARNAYDDRLIIEHFEIRAWVTVSQNYSTHEILSHLLHSMKLLDKTDQKNESKMAEIVHKTLKNRRYLIVMDDVWSTKACDDVRNIFPNDHNGSRIVLTTRLSDVAAYVDSCSCIHKMQLMDGNQSWNLLKQKVFANHQDCPLELEEVGKEIARRCGGLPLAIVLVAGVLSTVVKTRASWEEIAKNVISAVDEQLEKILSLSYTHLPHHLRPCFLYIGGFPEDYEIHVSRLIRLWVAEGFLKRGNGDKSLEEEAEEYLEELVKRSLVLVTSRKTDGKMKCCGLHDLVRDLCTRKAQEEKFLLHVTNRYNLPRERRISVFEFHLNKIQGPTIHTILGFQFKDIWGSLDFVEIFRLLRVLDVVNNYLELLPSQLFELFHLRYLALGTPTSIPSDISKLENLQTLIINPRADQSIRALPLEIWGLPQLRHLVFPHCFILRNPAGGSFLPLENLQTLLSLRGLVCSEEILKMIPNLKKLKIAYFEPQDYQLHNLIHLHQLEKLKVILSGQFWRSRLPPTFRFGGASWRGQNPAFPTTLKKLTLEGGQLPWKDMGRIGSLPNLEVLKLIDYACYDGTSSETWETAYGEFPQLKFLLIEKSHLQYWITECSHFPRLECLVLRRCPCLTAIPSDIGEIPTLELIEVDDLNQSLVESAKQIQEDQQSYGNDALQVRFIQAL